MALPLLEFGGDLIDGLRAWQLHLTEGSLSQGQFAAYLDQLGQSFIKHTGAYVNATFAQSLDTLYEYLETGDTDALQRGVYLADLAQEAW